MSGIVRIVDIKKENINSINRNIKSVERKVVDNTSKKNLVSL